MRKWLTRIGVFVSALVLTVFFGCTVFQDAVSPMRISKEAKDYAGMNDANDKGWFEQLLPWDSVLLGVEVETKMNLAHERNQRKLRRGVEDDILIFGFHSSGHLNNMQHARDFQQTIFSSSGSVGALIPLLSGGVLAGALIPRLGEKKKVADAKEEGKREGIKEANNIKA